MSSLQDLHKASVPWKFHFLSPDTENELINSTQSLPLTSCWFIFGVHKIFPRLKSWLRIYDVGDQHWKSFMHIKKPNRSKS